MSCQHTDFRLYKGWLLCCDCESAIRASSPKGYYLLQQRFAALQKIQKIHQSLLDDHRSLCQEAGTTNVEELAEYINQKAKKTNAERLSTQDTFAITVDSNGVRQPRFSNLSATKADFYKRWLERNEPKSRPQIELSYQEEKAIDDFYLWIEKQPPETVKEFAVAAFVHLVGG